MFDKLVHRLVAKQDELHETMRQILAEQKQVTKLLTALLKESEVKVKDKRKG